MVLITLILFPQPSARNDPAISANFETEQSEGFQINVKGSSDCSVNCFRNEFISKLDGCDVGSTSVNGVEEPFCSVLFIK